MTHVRGQLTGREDTMNRSKAERHRLACARYDARISRLVGTGNFQLLIGRRVLRFEKNRTQRIACRMEYAGWPSPMTVLGWSPALAIQPGVPGTREGWR